MQRMIKRYLANGHLLCSEIKVKIELPCHDKDCTAMLLHEFPHHAVKMDVVA